MLSDTSSDSGVIEDVRVLASPGLDDGPSRLLLSPGLDSSPGGLLSPGLDSPVYSPAGSVDLIDYLSNGKIMQASSPRFMKFVILKNIKFAARTGLWIRLHFLRIWIQLFFSVRIQIRGFNTDPDPALKMNVDS